MFWGSKIQVEAEHLEAKIGPKSIKNRSRFGSKSKNKGVQHRLVKKLSFNTLGNRFFMIFRPLQNHKNLVFDWEVSQKSNFEVTFKNLSKKEVPEPSDTVRTRRSWSTWWPKFVQNRPKIVRFFDKNRERKGFNIDF